VDRAFNEGDIEAVLRFYEDNAVVVTEPGKLARGQRELRGFFEAVLASKMSARQLKTYVVEAEGIALFISRWTLITSESNEESPTRIFVATTVLRKQSDGKWKALIDNSFGPLVLGPE
jgi:uncharacterized protein (TIGR02246 family)